MRLVLPPDTVVGSLDVKALYPSIDIEHTANIVEMAYNNNDYEVINTNTEEIGLYLAVNLSTQELQNAGLSDYCPTRKHKTGRPPNITGCIVENDKDKRFKPWNSPKSIPDDVMKKKLLAKALNIAVKFTMSNHVYSFGPEMKKQSKGGPIGLELTGEIANIYMAWWDEQFKMRLQANDIEVYMYKRYVDDINMIAKAIPSSAPENTPKDKATFERAREIGNQVSESIQLTADYPSKYEDNKVPILDVKVWTHHNVISENETKTTILHEYYEKAISAKTVVHASTAMPTKSKRSIITQEILRVLLRCSPQLPWQQTVNHVNQKMLQIQNSGHSESFRYATVQAALKAYDRMRDEDIRGIRPLYREKSWQYKEREQSKKKKKTNWFRGKNNDKASTVLFVPATPNSTLQKQFTKIIKEAEINIKIVEKAGESLKSKLQRSNPFNDKTCADSECILCKNNTNSKCRVNNVTYQITCEECDDVYVGETSRNLYTRMHEHMQDYKI